MLKFIPEIKLPKDLEIPYTPEIFDWVKSNMHGMKYITFKKYLSRERYDAQCCKIIINENATANQLPEEKANDICEAIFLVLQYQVEALDSAGRYCVTIYRKTDKGSDKPTAKHIKVGNDSTGERDSEVFDPSKLDANILDAQMAYIVMLQDSNANLMGMAPNLIIPIIEMNKELQKKVLELGGQQVRLKEIEILAETEKEEQKIRLLLEQAKIKGNNEKLESALKHLNKSGALDHFINQGAAKLFGNTSGNEEIKKQPKKKQQPKTQGNQDEVEKQKREQAMRDIEEGLKIAPLFTYCVMLKNSLTQDEAENGNDSINKYIEDELPSGMVKDFQELLDSESEQEALTNLRNMHSNLSDEDFPKLFFLRSKMNETQQKIITKILKFLEENEDNKEE